MAEKKKTGEDRSFKYWVKRLWSNYVVRNIVLAVCMLIILAGLASVLLNLFTRHNNYKRVPDFIGATLSEAGELARPDKLRIEINDSLYVPLHPPGVILDQNPEPGTEVKSGRRVFVTVNSYRPKMVDIPYVAGYSLRQAKSLLEVAGLQIDRLIYVDDIATNNVLEQRLGNETVTPEKKLRAETGTGITLVVGRIQGAEPVVMPKVVGFSLHEAKNRLWEVGFNAGSTVYDNDINVSNRHNAKVYRQEPTPNKFMPLGTAVNIFLTVDSLTLANGMKEAEDVGRGNLRERFLTDSLVRSGLPSSFVQGEVDYILRRERGQLTPADSIRSAEELLRALENTDETNIREDDFFD